MSEFVNYKKRGIQLPKGCKDLSDVLKLQQFKARSTSPGFMGNAKCDYCGGLAVGGSSSSVDGILSEHFWCEQCLKDWSEFYARPENKLPENLDSEDEGVVKLLDRQLEEIERRADEFVRRRVAERKGAP